MLLVMRVYIYFLNLLRTAKVKTCAYVLEFFLKQQGNKLLFNFVSCCNFFPKPMIIYLIRIRSYLHEREPSNTNIEMI
jgi:hypothetical protein